MITAIESAETDEDRMVCRLVYSDWLSDQGRQDDSERQLKWHANGTCYPPEINGYDWQEAFKYAKEPDPEPPGSNVDKSGFTRADVIEVIKTIEGQNDEASWVGVFRLADGRYACLEASCDYTGWG